MSSEIIYEISPRSIILKKNLKVPMVLLTWTTATICGTNLCLFKCVGEILTEHDFWNMPIMVTSFVTFVVCMALTQVFVFNTALRYYNNLDVIPIYQSLNLTMMLVCGWILLDEIKNYEWNEIAGLICSSMLTIVGIKVITMKTSVSVTLRKTALVD